VALTPLYEQMLAGLGDRGWTLVTRTTRREMPAAIASRYSWLPAEHRALIEMSDVIVSPDEKSWFSTVADLHQDSGLAFRWNEWELQSLEALEGHPEAIEEVRAFWDRHFPMMLSVKSCYAHISIERDSGLIVCGTEPEYEESSLPLAPSMSEFIAMLLARDEALDLWI
jgi:hypothetical protein